MKNEYKLVALNDVIYVVAFDKKRKPFVFDFDRLQTLPNVRFHVNTYGYVIFSNESSKELLHIYLSTDPSIDGESIDHINRIPSDNRKSNLRVANRHIQRKNQVRNRSSTTDCPLDLSSIPSYIWYVKANGNHGDRFCVEIGDYVWKTTSSKQFGVKYKLEEAKKHLRHLIQNNSELFCDTPFHGELSEQAKQLKEEYIEILSRAGEQYDDKDPIQYLEEDLTGLTEQEVRLLHCSGETNNQRPRCSLPENCGFKSENIPKYCYYVPATESKGDAFCVSRHHPKHKDTNKDWTTTKKRNITTKQKFDMMLKYLRNEEIDIQSYSEQSQPKVSPVKTPKSKESCITDLTQEQMLFLINSKALKQTTEKVSKDFKEKYNIYIRRNVISELWLGKIKVSDDIQKTMAYKEMLSNNRKRVKVGKFTDEEIQFMTTCPGSLAEVVEQVDAKFNKSVTKAYVSKLKRK